MDPNRKSTYSHLSQSQREIMRRVRVISFVHAFLGSPVVGAVAMLSLIFIAGMTVSLHHVGANIIAHQSWPSCITYTISSLLHTRVIVQVLAVCILALGSLILVNSIRTIRRSGFFALFNLRRV